MRQARKEAMRAHIVLAHPEPKSYNGHLARLAEQALSGRGWQVTLSDLSAMGFDPCRAQQAKSAKDAGKHSATRPNSTAIPRPVNPLAWSRPP